jgi:hypothetical protein
MRFGWRGAGWESKVVCGYGWVRGVVLLGVPTAAPVASHTHTTSGGPIFHSSSLHMVMACTYNTKGNRTRQVRAGGQELAPGPPGGAQALTSARAAGHPPTRTPRRPTHHTCAVRARGPEAWSTHTRVRRAPSQRRRGARACAPGRVRPGHPANLMTHTPGHGGKRLEGPEGAPPHPVPPATRPSCNPHGGRPRRAAAPPPARASPCSPAPASVHPPPRHSRTGLRSARAPGPLQRRSAWRHGGGGEGPEGGTRSPRHPTPRRQPPHAADENGAGDGARRPPRRGRAPPRPAIPGGRPTSQHAAPQRQRLFSWARADHTNGPQATAAPRGAHTARCGRVMWSCDAESLPPVLLANGAFRPPGPSRREPCADAGKQHMNA